MDFLVHQVQLAIKYCLFTGIVLLFGCKNQPTEFVNSTSKNFVLTNDIIYADGKLFTGTVFNLYENSIDTLQITSYKNGLLDGKFINFYPNQKVRSIRYFEEGKKVGNYDAWWQNGKKQLEYQFTNDEYNGTCKEWNVDGQLIKLMNYKMGHEDGSQQLWYDNGKVRANYIIKDGRRFGLLGTKNCVNVTDSIFATK